MNEKNRYKEEKPGSSPERNSWDDPGFEMLLAPGDSALFGQISDCIKGLSDIGDIKSDPAYSVINEEVKVMVTDYQKKTIRNRGNEKFIRDSFAEETNEDKLSNEINYIKDEITRNNLNNITSEWIKEWHEKGQRNINKDPKTEEIRNFITGSLRQEEIRVEIKSDESNRKGLSKSLITRYTSLAAAAIISAVLLIRSLLPSNDPQKIFSKYYEPYNAVSEVTRGIVTGGNVSFEMAIESYKSKDYQAAAVRFTDAVLNESTSVSARFFLGITEIQLGNYNKAIELLAGVAGQPGEYTKEAGWYLGLAYAKSGDKAKASECFRLLAQSPGYYSERSEKIFRRLK